jgi:diphthamide synthase subunit DPH2
MKWYLASRTRHKDLINQVVGILKESGHEASYEWAQLENFYPYKENKEISEKVASDALEGVIRADVFVLISDEAGTDMFVELGAALATSENKRIYIVGEYNNRSLMHFHPAVVQKKTIQEVFEVEDKNILRHKNISNIKI